MRCGWDGRCDASWFDVDVTRGIGPYVWAGDAERGCNAGERGRFGDNVKCKRASESFGFADVGSGVSGSDEEEVDGSE
jgi:hypothetical protein